MVHYLFFITNLNLKSICVLSHTVNLENLQVLSSSEPLQESLKTPDWFQPHWFSLGWRGKEQKLVNNQSQRPPEKPVAITGYIRLELLCCSVSLDSIREIWSDWTKNTNAAQTHQSVQMSYRIPQRTCWMFHSSHLLTFSIRTRLKKIDLYFLSSDPPGVSHWRSVWAAELNQRMIYI